MEKQRLRKSKSKVKRANTASVVSTDPKMYSIFTDYRVYAGIVLLIMLFLIASSGVKLYKSIQKKNKVVAERNILLNDVRKWEEIAKRYPGYRDGYFNLALLEYRLGSTRKAKEYLNKTLELDPNFEAGRKLEKLID